VKGETVSLAQPASTTLQAVANAQCPKSLPQRRMPWERTFHTTTDRSSFAVATLLSRQGYCTVKNGGWNAIMVPGIHTDLPECSSRIWIPYLHPAMPHIHLRGVKGCVLRLSPLPFQPRDHPCSTASYHECIL
jgi:hypothetical protein